MTLSQGWSILARPGGSGGSRRGGLGWKLAWDAGPRSNSNVSPGQPDSQSEERPVSAVHCTALQPVIQSRAPGPGADTRAAAAGQSRSGSGPCWTGLPEADLR